MILKRGLVFAAALLAGSAAWAAEPIDLVGTWAPTGEKAAAMYGDDTDHHPEAPTPTLGSTQDWSIIIRAQEGRSFHGVARSPRGAEETIVGVISYNGDRLIMAGEEAGFFGEIIGDQIEFCYQDHDDDRAMVACFLTAKE